MSEIIKRLLDIIYKPHWFSWVETKICLDLTFVKKNTLVFSVLVVNSISMNENKGV